MWWLVSIIVIACAAVAIFLLFQIDLDAPATYPLMTALIGTAALAVAALGWGVGGWVAHRNARVQHTLTIIATRFAQPLFVQQMTIFNNAFGDADDSPKVTQAIIDALAETRSDGDQAKVQSARYLMNYFEFIATGVRSGELDLAIVRNNLRASFLYFHAKCEPYIVSGRAASPTLLENFTRLHDHFAGTDARVGAR